MNEDYPYLGYKKDYDAEWDAYWNAWADHVKTKTAKKKTRPKYNKRMVTNYRKRRDEEVKRRIEENLKNHVIEVKQDDGLHRRWRCSSPGQMSYWFEVITWPGSLCINGDFGTFVFSRTADMINFMRTSAMSYSYAAEKCQAEGKNEKVDEYCRDVALESIDNDINDLIDELNAFDEDAEESDWQDIVKRINELKSVRKEVVRADHEYEAQSLMYQSGLYDCEVPTSRAYTLHFLWCLHAIKWLCDRVEDAKEPKPRWKDRICQWLRHLDYA